MSVNAAKFSIGAQYKMLVFPRGYQDSSGSAGKRKKSLIVCSCEHHSRVNVNICVTELGRFL